MSKYVNEIIKDIKDNPSTWKRYGNKGLQKDNIVIDSFGNGHLLLIFWVTSIVEVSINNLDTNSSLSWLDRIKLENTFRWWMRNMPLNIISK